jgi:formamidopyrimidine-DNA glycosylase
MPELPEVETTRRGIEPHLLGRNVVAVTLRATKLRFPLEQSLCRVLSGRSFQAVARRGKYLLLTMDGGTLLIHLGMSGHLHLSATGSPAGKHDHFELQLDNGYMLRLNDPRKFGTVLWLVGDPGSHPLLAGLGPEPLQNDFSAKYLYEISRKRTVAIKLLLMNSRLVVGIGNIYANEALFHAGIAPQRLAGSLTLPECRRLVAVVKSVLTESIERGGTSLRDYVDVDGNPGYFGLDLKVYGREGEICLVCETPLQQSRLGGRATCWCPVCQPVGLSSE